MEKYIIVVAGGRGTRMGGDVPKQFLPLECFRAGFLPFLGSSR